MHFTRIKNLFHIRIIQNIVLLFCVILFLISLIELYFKIFSPQIMSYTSKGLLIPDKKCGYRLAPNFRGFQSQSEYVVTIKTNSQGFRSKEIMKDKPENVFRIIVLGDSFTMGYGIENEQTWCSHLENLLNEYNPVQKKENYIFEVINCGVGGYGTKQSIELFNNYCLELKPDLVVLGFFIGNDIYDNADIEPMTVWEGQLIFKSNLNKYLHEKNKLFSLNLFLNKLHIVHFIKNRFQVIKGEKVIIPIEDWYKNQFYHQLAILLKNPPQIISRQINNSFEVIKKFKEDLDLKNIPLLVVLIPFREQINKVRRETVIRKIFGETYNLKETNYDFAMPQKRFISFFEKNNIFVCDLLPSLATSQNNSKLYYLYDVHFTEQGAKESAEIIHRYFLRNLNIFGIKK